MSINKQIAVKFTNISDQLFIGMWDKTEYTINPGETLTVPLYLAKHFAKHLVNQISKKVLSMVEDENGIPKDKERRELYQKMISSPLFAATNDTEMRTKIMNDENAGIKRHNPETNENVNNDNKVATSYADKAVIEPVREEVKPFAIKDEEFEGLEDEEIEEETNIENAPITEETK